MFRATITCPWTGSGKDSDPFRPAPDKYSCSWGDTTALPVPPIPDPNVASVEVLADGETLDAMDADPDIIVWYTEEEEHKPSRIHRCPATSIT